MRVDLVDVNGKVKLSNLFKIDQFETDGQYHLYSHQFSGSTDGSFNLDQIKQIRIYLNYGVLGQAGSGTVRIKNMRLQNPNATSIFEFKSGSFSVFPNPVHGLVTIQSKEKIHSLQLYSASGQLVLTRTIGSVNRYQFSVVRLKPGYYLLKVNGKSAQKLSVY